MKRCCKCGRLCERTFQYGHCMDCILMEFDKCCYRSMINRVTIRTSGKAREVYAC